jgi:kinesin family protein 5
MSVKGKVNVFSRVRPGLAREDGDQHCITNHQELKKCVVRVEDDAVERVLAGGSAAPGKVTEKAYSFDGVFDPECTQKEVYEEVGKPVLKDVLQGYNGSILAYGQTSAGKTHSLLNSGMGMDGRP